ncbi:hypothetical protein BA950_09300 [Erythrobacter sp. SAORIC-644]|uniref:hypothetical protein n=1 Tax=Erythrobacter sp. SAORIC-644 TaxID=1869314 RepID=UPI000C9F5EC9|nr:hypothetical protein [Erythrobacter sp. SAORIC-644]PNQ76006.1 hypothetical protein BA950_09300 [Erythrobacter sp. SAORIC-644]
MKSPFEDLQIDAALVCEFFGLFARFEYAMKATKYCGTDRHGNAIPDWRKLKAEMGEPIAELQEHRIVDAIAYLLDEPPQVQKYVNSRPEFMELDLDGENSGAKAIEAAKRVRNNLFHGGKHTPHSPPERDTRLIEASLAVIEACLSVDEQLKTEFEHQVI